MRRVATVARPLRPFFRCASACTALMVAPPSDGRGSFFDFFELPPDVELDRVKLNQRYHAIQADAHPDKQVGVAKEQRTLNEEDSIFANQGYETLRDPFLRARYLLRLADLEEDMLSEKGRPATPREREQFSVAPPPESGGDAARFHPGSARARTHSVKPSGEYLGAMMELNESFDDVSAMEEKEAATHLKQLLSTLDGYNDQFWKRICSAWRAKDRDAFRAEVMNWSYVYKLRARIKERM